MGVAAKLKWKFLCLNEGDSTVNSDKVVQQYLKYYKK